jgi:hypothetical protein
LPLHPSSAYHLLQRRILQSMVSSISYAFCYPYFLFQHHSAQNLSNEILLQYLTKIPTSGFIPSAALSSFAPLRSTMVEITPPRLLVSKKESECLPVSNLSGKRWE